MTSASLVVIPRDPGSSVRAPVPLNGYVPFPRELPDVIEEDTEVFLRTGVLALATDFPNAETMLRSYPTGVQVLFHLDTQKYGILFKLGVVFYAFFPPQILSISSESVSFSQPRIKSSTDGVAWESSEVGETYYIDYSSGFQKVVATDYVPTLRGKWAESPSVRMCVTEGSAIPEDYEYMLCKTEDMQTFVTVLTRPEDSPMTFVPTPQGGEVHPMEASQNRTGRLYRSVTYGNGKFVAVAESISGTFPGGVLIEGQAPYYLDFSIDGRLWGLHNTPNIGSIVSPWLSPVICFSSGLFYLILSDGRFFTSTDCVIWSAERRYCTTQQAVNPSEFFVNYSSSTVVIYLNGTVYVTTNGVDWVSRFIPNNLQFSIHNSLKPNVLYSYLVVEGSVVVVVEGRSLVAPAKTWDGIRDKNWLVTFHVTTDSGATWNVYNLPPGTPQPRSVVIHSPSSISFYPDITGEDEPMTVMTFSGPQKFVGDETAVYVDGSHELQYWKRVA